MNRRTFAGRLAACALGAAGCSQLGLKLVADSPAHTAAFHLSVMLWTLRPKYPVEQAIELVGRAGYNGFELVDEDKHWSATDVARVRARMAALSLKCDAISGIDTGFAQPGAGRQLAEELTARIEQAERLDCRRIILLSGKRVEAMPRDQQHAVCVENLKRAGDIAAARRCELLIEPIDALENPSIYLTHVAEAFGIARAVQSPAVKVLYDFYHEAQGIQTPEQSAALLQPLKGNMDLLGLVHVANVPGRHAPGAGRIRYAELYAALRQAGYTGWMAMEFMPLGDAETELRRAAQQTM